ncbi:hypothetical protein WG904_11555 [Pedobacter sp. Du54]
MTNKLRNHHLENHLKSAHFITDMVIRMNDGLTVPFAWDNLN